MSDEEFNELKNQARHLSEIINKNITVSQLIRIKIFSRTQEKETISSC